MYTEKEWNIGVFVNGLAHPYPSVHSLMDADICAEIEGIEGTGSPQGFVDAYCQIHAVKYGEVFEVN